MKYLQYSFNPGVTSIIEIINYGMDMIVDQSNFALFVDGIQEEPSNLKEVWNHPVENNKTKYQEDFQKEFKQMNLQGIWTKIKRSEVPVGS
jgi:hypothetical protein